MTLARKILIAIAGLIVLLILLNYGASYYISKRLPSILHAEKDFPYNISYDDLDINLLTGSLTAHNAYIAPKDSTSTALKKGLFGKVKKVQVRHCDLWALLRTDKIIVKAVVLDTPEAILYESKKKYNVEDDFVKPFKKTIRTGSVEVIDGNFKMLDTMQRIAVKASNIDFKILDIKVDSATVEQNIPVKYSDYKFTCDSVFYRMDNVYNVTASRVINSDTSMVVSNVKLIPKYTRASFTKNIGLEKDLFTITVKTINLPKVEWGYLKDILYVHAPTVSLNNVYANVYRNKIPKDDPSVKKMYSELLRSLKFDLKADRVLVKNSQIVYEEQNNFSVPPGKVTFSNFYGTLHNVYSPVNKGKLPNTVIDAQCMFMKATPLKATWTFNTLNKSDSFTFTGSLQSIRIEQINAISNPLMNINAKGLITKLRFTINGNRNNATGSFAIDYDDLKVEVLEDDRKGKKRLLSAIGNLFIKNDSDEKLKQTSIQVTRAKDKSFFNFLWLCMQDGLRKAILPKFVEKRLPEVKPPREDKKKKKDD